MARAMLAHLKVRSGPSRYVAGAALLTFLWLLTRALAPPGGLTRSYYYPSPATPTPSLSTSRRARAFTRGRRASI